MWDCLSILMACCRLCKTNIVSFHMCFYWDINFKKLLCHGSDNLGLLYKVSIQCFLFVGI